MRKQKKIEFFPIELHKPNEYDRLLCQKITTELKKHTLWRVFIPATKTEQGYSIVVAEHVAKTKYANHKKFKLNQNYV
jgi:hypothetical protein